VRSVRSLGNSAGTNHLISSRFLVIRSRLQIILVLGSRRQRLVLGSRRQRLVLGSRRRRLVLGSRRRRLVLGRRLPFCSRLQIILVLSSRRRRLVLGSRLRRRWTLRVYRQGRWRKRRREIW
jgi:hypothetical protein